MGSGSVLPADFDGADHVTVRAVRALDLGRESLGGEFRAGRASVPAPARGMGSVHTSHIRIAQAIKRSEAEHVRDVVDVWLRDKPPLPAARITWTGSDRRRS